MRRAYFNLAASAVLALTSALGALSADGDLPVDIRGITLLAILAHLAFIRLREADLQPRRRWRFWYAVAIGALAALWIVSVYVPSTVDDRMRLRSQAILGGYYLFLILSTPALVGCIFRRSRAFTVHTASRNRRMVR
jgi:hypothetical protein